MAASVPTTEKGRATRRRVVQAATRIVIEKGVAAMSLDDVGERARVSRSQLYHYFEDRDDLLCAVVDATTEMVLGAQDGHLEDLGSWAAIDGWIDHILALQATPRGCPLGSLVGQLAERDERARIALAVGFGRWEAHLADGLLRLGAARELRADADPAQLATATMASLQGGLMLGQVHRDPVRLRRALDGARAMLHAARAVA